jgi:hypothetical protein
VEEGGRKVLDWLVEGSTEGEVGERGGEAVYGLVEVVSKQKLSELGRKVVDGMIEAEAKGEVGEGGGEVFDGLGKVVTERQSVESRGEDGINGVIETGAES